MAAPPPFSFVEYLAKRTSNPLASFGKEERQLRARMRSLGLPLVYLEENEVVEEDEEEDEGGAKQEQRQAPILLEEDGEEDLIPAEEEEEEMALQDEEDGRAQILDEEEERAEKEEEMEVEADSSPDMFLRPPPPSRPAPTTLHAPAQAPIALDEEDPPAQHYPTDTSVMEIDPPPLPEGGTRKRSTKYTISLPPWPYPSPGRHLLSLLLLHELLPPPS